MIEAPSPSSLRAPANGLGAHNRGKSLRFPPDPCTCSVQSTPFFAQYTAPASRAPFNAQSKPDLDRKPGRYAREKDEG